MNKFSKNSTLTILCIFLLGISNFSLGQDSIESAKYYQDGIKLFNSGKRIEAEQAFRTAISFDSTGNCGTGIIGNAYSKLGSALYLQSDFVDGKIDHSKDEQALPFLRKAVELNPFNPEPLTSIGVVYIILKNDSAGYYINKAITNFPTYAKAYYQRARITDEDKHPDKVLRDINLFFKYYNSNEDGLMHVSAKLIHLQLQKKLGMLTLKMFQDTLQTYYLNKCDSLIDFTIIVFNYPTTETQYMTSIVRGFYGALFKNNPSIKSQFEERKTEFDQPEFYKLFNEILIKDLSKIEAEHLRNPSFNDFYWGCFFATGEIKYLDQILDNCSHIKNKEIKDLYLMAGTAMWSMCSNSTNNELVRNYLRDKAKDGNKFAKKKSQEKPEILLS